MKPYMALVTNTKRSEENYDQDKTEDRQGLVWVAFYDIHQVNGPDLFFDERTPHAVLDMDWSGWPDNGIWISGLFCLRRRYNMLYRMPIPSSC